MAKPDPALLIPERYPFQCAIATRFGDLDINLHINNVALAGICEDARVRFHKASGSSAVLGRKSGGPTSMVASFAIEYLGQGFHPDPLDVHVGAERIGNSSYSLVQLIRQGGRAIAFARSTLVAVQEDRPTPISQAFRDTISPWMLRA